MSKQDEVLSSKLNFGLSLDKFVFGGISCMMAACVTNPIDVIKVRLQLQKKPNYNLSSSTVQYRGFLHGLITMYKTEGIKSWYSGLNASLIREGSYSTLRMGLYEPFKEYLHPKKYDNSKPLPLYKKVLAAALAGGVGAFIANPTDLVKVRLQASVSDLNSIKYASTWDAFCTIYKNEGWAGLYRGVGPTTQRAMLLTGSQLASYDHFKHWLLSTTFYLSSYEFTFKEGLSLHFATSILAGLVAAITTSPVDTIKSRYMNQKFMANGKGQIYKSPLHCLKHTVKNEGWLALYKGFFPNWIRIGPHTVVTFIIFEKLRNIFGVNPI